MNNYFSSIIAIISFLLFSHSCFASQPINKSQDEVNRNSPFGIHPASPFDEAADIGVKWSRGLNNPYMFWFLVDPGMTGEPAQFQWKGIARKPGKAGGFDYDKLIAAKESGLNILYNIEVEPRRMGQRKHDSWLPADEEAYKIFVKEAVKRYPFIQYWQIGNEPSYNERMSDYGKFLLITYEAIKEANPRAKVLIGGVSGLRMPQDTATYKNNFDRVYLPLLEDVARQKKRCFDIFDFHWFAQAGGDYKIAKDAYNYIREKISELNIPEPESYWITETGTYSGDPKSLRREGKFVDFPYQSEREQAIDLIKRYVYPLSFGVKKVFWAWGLKEGFHYDESFFDFTGLIYDGKFDHDQGRDVKKLSYYTYKKMIEILEGSDWDNIQAIQEAGGIYIYKFTKGGKSIWVVWNDNSKSQTVILNVGSIDSVKITEAVPKYELGKDVSDYSSVFNTETKSVSGGLVSITLGDKPVFVEEK